MLIHYIDSKMAAVGTGVSLQYLCDKSSPPQSLKDNLNLKLVIVNDTDDDLTDLRLVWDKSDHYQGMSLGISDVRKRGTAATKVDLTITLETYGRFVSGQKVHPG